MDLLEKHLDTVIAQKALSLFFYNWNTYPSIVDEMKAEDSGFNHAWNNLIDSSRAEYERKGGMWIIQYTEIYSLFVSKLTYRSQALLIEKVLEYYGDEAKKAVEFSVKMNLMAEKQRNKYSQQKRS